MNAGSRRLDGFTLIELLIATSLGLVICASAFSCVRMCAQAGSLVQRLSLENQCMRQGMWAALHELDTWDYYDSPSDPGDRPLRGKGDPFQPLQFGGGLHADFAQSDPSSWWRGLGCAMNRKDYGDYAQFSRIDHPLPARRACALFQRRMVEELGYYALCDYAPASAIYSYYDENGDVPNPYSNTACAPNCIGWDAGRSPGDFCMLLDGGAFALTRQADYLAAGVSQHRFFIWGGVGIGWDPYWKQQGLYASGDEVPQPSLLPTHWPRAQLVIRHFAGAYRQWNTATVTVSSPLTGGDTKLHFSTTSTTLRGARLQRGLDLP
jgi:prepilin-type N-terminal cleavage/methylation domain-containing protein